MEHQSLHRMEIAKQRLRKKLSFEHITSIPEYKNYSVEEYEKMMGKIETLALMIIEIYREKHMGENEDDVART